MENNKVPDTTETKTNQAPLRIVSRAEWGSNTKLYRVDNMKGPANSVFLRYYTGNENCWTEDECKVVVKGIQWKHRKKISDIGFNFLIDRNGTIYEGMGWGKKCGTPDFDIGESKLGCTLEKMINLAFIGNFAEWEVTPQMKESVDDLVEYAARKKFLTPKYKFLNIERPK